MVKESPVSPSAAQSNKIGYKIVSYAEYLEEARNLLKQEGSVNGMKDVWNVAQSLVFHYNNVIPGGIVTKAGEQRYVCKI